MIIVPIFEEPPFVELKIGFINLSCKKCLSPFLYIIAGKRGKYEAVRARIFRRITRTNMYFEKVSVCEIVGICKYLSSFDLFL